MSKRSGRMDGQQERAARVSADEVMGSSIDEWKHTFTHAILVASAEGIEKAIMDYRESVEDILRPLAEAKAPCPERPVAGAIQSSLVGGGMVFRHWAKCTGGCRGTGEIADPRFEALRGKAWVRQPSDLNWEIVSQGGIDASLGAIVRAAAACGLDVVELFQWPGGAWTCYLRHFISVLPSDPPQPHGSGDTPEEALARALVAAWREEKAHLGGEAP